MHVISLASANDKYKYCEGKLVLRKIVTILGSNGIYKNKKSVFGLHINARNKDELEVFKHKWIFLLT